MTKYTIVPAAQYPFDRLDALSRYVFGLIWDRWKLSARSETWHKWTDEKGIYCVYEQAQLARELGVSAPTLRRCIDACVKEGLLEKERADKYGACRYYSTWRSRTAMGVPEGYAEYMNSIA